MTTNDILTDLERDLESDLIEARHELREAEKEALDDVSAFRDELGEGVEDAATEIHALVTRAENDLTLVQRRLGELNYILAEEKIDDLATFDRYRDRILGALRTAQQDLTSLEKEGEGRSRQDHSFSDAWKRLARRFDSVREHLAGEAKVAKRGFAEERLHLVEEIESAEVGVVEGHRVGIVSRLRAEFDQALPGIRAMFMYQGEVEAKKPESP